MKTTPASPLPAPARTRRSAGRVSPRLLAALVVLGLGISAVVYLAVDRFGSDDTGSQGDHHPSAAQIASELASLKEQFNAAVREPQALPRIEARARDFSRRHPDQPDGYVLLAQVQIQLGKWPRAYEALTRAMADQPPAVELLRFAGVCAAKLGRLPDAEQHYRDAIAAAGDSADSDLYASLGRLYLASEKIDLAEQAFDQAVAARSSKGKETNWRHAGHAGLADVASMRGDFETAHQQIDTALRFAGSDSQADATTYRIQKARIYMDAGQNDDAVTMLVYTWDEDPDARWRIESARLRARLFQRAGQIDKAVNHVALVCDYHQRETDRKDYELANYYALLAQWQITAGQRDAAAISLDNVETLLPQHPQLDELWDRLQKL